MSTLDGVKFLQVTGFKDFLAFSNYNLPETRGQVILIKNGPTIKTLFKLEGNDGQYLGEYIMMSEDAPEGNLILGITKRMENDSFDHVTLYKVLTKEDGTEELFKLTEHATHTIVSPARDSLNSIKSTR